MMKKHPSKLAEAIANLKKNGYTITVEGEKYKCVRHPEYCPSSVYGEYTPDYTYTARELIKFSDSKTSNSKQNTTIKGNLKREHKSRERRFVKDRLRTQRVDDETDVNFPRKKFSDIWSWD
jgi:hypothetical protein